MRITPLLTAAAFFAIGAPAAAQEVLPCDWQASAQSIVEPWSENSLLFANGEVRVTHLDTIEPAVAFAYLMIQSPPYDELGGRQCVVVGHGPSGGFAGLDFDTLVTGYDPAIGLIFEVVVQVYVPDASDFATQLLAVTLNQSTGATTATLSADTL